MTTNACQLVMVIKNLTLSAVGLSRRVISGERISCFPEFVNRVYVTAAILKYDQRT